MSRNIEINIKTQDESTQETQYEVLYPKNTAKNVLFNSDGSDNVTVYDKLNNITPNNSFELGDILLTSKINVDLDKWALCDGKELSIENYPELGNITNLTSFNSFSDTSFLMKPTDLDLSGLWEFNGYYLSTGFYKKNLTGLYGLGLYYIEVDKDLTISSNWQKVELTDMSESKTSDWSISEIFEDKGYYAVFSSVKSESSSATWWESYCYILDSSFNLLYSTSSSLGTRLQFSFNNMVYNSNNNSIEIGCDWIYSGNSSNKYYVGKYTFNLTSLSYTSISTQFNDTLRANCWVKMEDNKLICGIFSWTKTNANSIIFYKAENPNSVVFSEWENVGTFTERIYWEIGGNFITTKGKYGNSLSNFPNYQNSLVVSINDYSTIRFFISKQFNLMYVYDSSLTTFYKYTYNNFEFKKQLLNRTGVTASGISNTGKLYAIVSSENKEYIEGINVPNISNDNSSFDYYIKVKN